MMATIHNKHAGKNNPRTAWPGQFAFLNENPSFMHWRKTLRNNIGIGEVFRNMEFGAGKPIFIFGRVTDEDFFRYPCILEQFPLFYTIFSLLSKDSVNSKSFYRGNSHPYNLVNIPSINPHSKLNNVK